MAFAFDFDFAARGDDTVVVRPATSSDYESFASKAEALAAGLFQIDVEAAVNVYKSKHGFKPRFELTPEAVASILYV